MKYVFNFRLKPGLIGVLFDETGGAAGLARGA